MKIYMRKDGGCFRVSAIKFGNQHTACNGSWADIHPLSDHKFERGLQLRSFCKEYALNSQMPRTNCPHKMFAAPAAPGVQRQIPDNQRGPSSIAKRHGEYCSHNVGLRSGWLPSPAYVQLNFRSRLHEALVRAHARICICVSHLKMNERQERVYRRSTNFVRENDMNFSTFWPDQIRRGNTALQRVVPCMAMQSSSN
jgi:hypothetical protein